VDQKLELLKAVPLFAELGARDLADVAKLTDEVDVRAGKVLMEEGRAGHEFFIIASGRVAVERGGQRIRDLGPGDFLGEIALVDGGPRTATATTETDTSLLVLAHREFNTLMAGYPAIRECVLRCLAKRVRAVDPNAS
jgi:voltage-gated potassium channel